MQHSPPLLGLAYQTTIDGRWSGTADELWEAKAHAERHVMGALEWTEGDDGVCTATYEGSVYRVERV